MPADRTVLIIDDNARLCESLSRNFETYGFASRSATNSTDALNEFRNRKFSAVLLDIMLGEDSGIDVLIDVKKIDPNVPIVMITGYATVETAVQSLKLGAADYVKKPLDFEMLFRVVENAMRVSRLSLENRTLKQRLAEHSPRPAGRNPAMQQLFQKVRKLAATDLPILIAGENGTGKELIADAIHSESRRAFEKVVKVNCAAFPETLLDNELFGHERGAFTGADSVYKGVFEQATAGTLFLDEIGDMPLTIQAKILRTLQNNEIRRIGGTRTISIDVRFVAATNQQLEELIAKNRFREDLYYRLSGAVITVPPLRDRLEDIPDLSETFVREYCLSNSLALKTMDREVIELFLAYPWPGNVRELKNAINYACAISSGPTLSIDDLPPALQSALRTRDRHAATGGLNVREQTEKEIIVKTLQKTNYNKKATAGLLSMSRKTLYNKIARYQIGTDSEHGIN